MAQEYTIVLVTQDGKEKRFSCSSEDSILEAAEQAGITIPAVCRKGTCGSCRGRCSKGKYNLKFFAEGVLSAAARERDEVLLCQTFAEGELRIEVPLDYAHIVAGPPPEFRSEVVANEDCGGFVRRLRLQALPDEAGTINSSFDAGQYMDLEIPGTSTRRAYSIASSPNWTGEFEFMIRLREGGHFSTWLENGAKPGATLTCCGPKGRFTLRDGSLNPRRFVAGGTGIAPMLSMLRQMAEFQSPQESKLYFGLTNEDEIFAQAEIDAIDASLPNLDVHFCLWKPSPTWKGNAGSSVTAFKEDLAADLAKGVTPDVYLCGPPGMVAASVAAIEELGLPHENVFSERFVAS
jgi:methane monooxygenase component C